MDLSWRKQRLSITRNVKIARESSSQTTSLRRDSWFGVSNVQPHEARIASAEGTPSPPTPDITDPYETRGLTINRLYSSEIPKSPHRRKPRTSMPFKPTSRWVKSTGSRDIDSPRGNAGMFRTEPWRGATGAKT